MAKGLAAARTTLSRLELDSRGSAIEFFCWLACMLSRGFREAAASLAGEDAGDGGMPSESACTLLASSPRPKGTRRGTALAPADEWTRAVEQTLSPPSRVCEVNLGTAHVALTFLCRFGSATYNGIDFRNESRRERRLLEQHLPGRAHIASGDDMRSVRAAPQLTGCDVLIMGMDDNGMRTRKRLFADLPNALRRAAPQSRVIMHGRECRAPKKHVVRPGCTLPSCSMHGWCQRWQELQEAGIINASQCHASPAGRRWCTGTLVHQSICHRSPLLESGSGGMWTRAVVKFERDTKRTDAERLPGPWRYFTVLPCTQSGAESGVCLFFKDGISEEAVGGLASADGLNFALPTTGAKLVLPRKWRHAAMTHNLAIVVDRGEFLAVGGLYNPTREAGAHANDGVWAARAASWQFEINGSLLGTAETRRASQQHGQWRDVRLLMNGKHPGCIEGRDPAVAPLAYPHICEFDGRWSLVFFRGQYFLYGRANPGLHGQRYVQVTRSADMHEWSAFELIEVRGYHHTQGDMYFLTVHVNPADPGSLIGLVPLVHRLGGCIGLTVSRDGQHWSDVTPLARCDVYGERTAHHPVAGLIPRGDVVDLYVHENVPGITADRVSERALRRFPYLRQPPSKLVRYSVAKTVLSTWTSAALGAMP
tara:strand:+ start:8 stop:1960 length:1953 start_codon:yes stop_codon:yes gene_type:complete